MLATARPESSRTNVSSSRASGWAPRFELAPTADRNALLIVAAEPLRTTLVDFGRQASFEIYTPATPLDAIQMLEKHHRRIAYAIVTSELPWAIELRQLIATDYPGIERIALVV